MAVEARHMPALLGTGSGNPTPGERIAAMFRDLDGALRSFLRRRVRCQHEAEDLAQEVYLRMTRHPDLDQVECLKAFAFQAALNLVRDRSRRSYTRSRSHSIPIDNVDLAGGDDPVEHAMHDERLDQVTQALAALPHSTQRAFMLHRIEGLRYCDIAADLGVSVSMVEKHLSAALSALREPPPAPAS
jgi:RNA polymerase sigma-70 factor (ECF subfamily)